MRLFRNYRARKEEWIRHKEAWLTLKQDIEQALNQECAQRNNKSDDECKFLQSQPKGISQISTHCRPPFACQRNSIATAGILKHSIFCKLVDRVVEVGRKIAFKQSRMRQKVRIFKE